MIPYRVRAERSRPADLLPHVRDQIEAVWEEELRRRPAGLHNGSVLSLLRQEGLVLWASVVEYKHALAQLRRPELYSALRIRPLAVSGLTWVGGALVFGRRAEFVSQEPGYWELVPSGGIDVVSSPVDEVDYLDQLRIELREELGITRADTTQLTPFCLVDDPATHVVDIGVEVILSCSPGDLLGSHRATASAEYDELQTVPSADLERFLDQHRGGVVAASRALLAARGLI